MLSLINSYLIILSGFMRILSPIKICIILFYSNNVAYTYVWALFLIRFYEYFGSNTPINKRYTFI